MRIVHQFTDGDSPVTLGQHEDGSGRFQVTWKERGLRQLTYTEAAHLYGEFVMLSLAAAGKIELQEEH